MKFIYCRGGDKLAPKVAQWAQMEYGTRYDYKAYAPVYMLDGGADAVAWDRYLEKVREYRPVMALTPDYFAHVDKHTLWAQIDALRTLGVERIAVCPKHPGAVANIPADCVVAVSVPTGYAGFLPLPGELIGRSLHLLGGYPDQHAYLMQAYLSAQVESIDLNVIGLKAAFGQFWTRAGGWQVAPKGRFSTFVLSVHSARNVRRYLDAPTIDYRRRRVQRAMYSHLMFDMAGEFS